MQYIRRALGWADPVNVPTDPCICVVGHTSYFDALIMILYRGDLNVMAVMAPKFFFWPLAPLLRLCGFIPTSRMEDRGAGGVQALVTTLREQQTNAQRPIALLISPKGTIQNRPWRTGYKHIAAGLGWPIKLMAIDYSKRIVHFIDANTEDPEALQDTLSNYCPMVPARSEYPIRCDYDPWELTVPVDMVAITSSLMMLSGFTTLALQHYGSALLTAVTMVISWRYHLSRETQYKDLDAVVAKLGFIYWLYFYPMNWSALGPTLAGFYFYYKGTPRDPGQKRGPYVLYHTLFHICFSIAAWLVI
jgi:hypothetical protein